MVDFERLIYDPDTGVFRWLSPTCNSLKTGQIAGNTRSDGYVGIGYGGKIYLAHRIAWFINYGHWPIGDVDHINGVKNDNRLANLRDVTHKVNGQNQRKSSKNNKSGYLGVVWHSQSCKWRANIRVNGKQKHIGSFTSPEAAHNAYLLAKRGLHEGCTI